MREAIEAAAAVATIAFMGALTAVVLTGGVRIVQLLIRWRP
jgi:hypothetical protein